MAPVNARSDSAVSGAPNSASTRRRTSSGDDVPSNWRTMNASEMPRRKYLLVRGSLMTRPPSAAGRGANTRSVRSRGSASVAVVDTFRQGGSSMAGRGTGPRPAMGCCPQQLEPLPERWLFELFEPFELLELFDFLECDRPEPEPEPPEPEPEPEPVAEP